MIWWGVRAPTLCLWAPSCLLGLAASQNLILAVAASKLRLSALQETFQVKSAPLTFTSPGVFPENTSAELTWSVPVDSCGQRQPPDGFVPFPGQELHSEKQHMIRFIPPQLQAEDEVLCRGMAPTLRPPQQLVRQP